MYAQWDLYLGTNLEIVVRLSGPICMIWQMFVYFAKISVTSYMLQVCVVILRPAKFYQA